MWLIVEEFLIRIYRKFGNIWISRECKEGKSNQEDYSKQKLKAERKYFGERENIAELELRVITNDIRNWSGPDYEKCQSAWGFSFSLISNMKPDISTHSRNMARSNNMERQRKKRLDNKKSDWMLL